MSNASKAAFSKPVVAPDQTAQTTVEEGTWMMIQDAVKACCVSEKTIRRYIKSKALKSRRLGKLSNSPLQVWITNEFSKSTLEEPVEEETEEEVEFLDAETENLDGSYIEEDFTPEPEPVQNVSLEIDRVIRSIAEQFGSKLDEHKEVIFQLKQELQEKEIQLRLLPDLQKKLEEEEKLKHFETTALQKQVEELNKENAELKEVAEQLKKAAAEKKSWWSWLSGK